MRLHLGVIVLFLVAAIPANGERPVASRTSEQIITHHLAAFAANDLEGLLGDYADTATVITPRGTTTGKPALRKMFAGMMAAPQPETQLTANVFTDTVGYRIGYIVWVQHLGQADERRGTDSFFILDGKIVAQTAALIMPAHSPPPK